eukprot:359985-Chlamydomonas_euryale.AAC.16
MQKPQLCVHAEELLLQNRLGAAAGGYASRRAWVVARGRPRQDGVCAGDHVMPPAVEDARLRRQSGCRPLLTATHGCRPSYADRLVANLSCSTAGRRHLTPWYPSTRLGSAAPAVCRV